MNCRPLKHGFPSLIRCLLLASIANDLAKKCQVYLHRVNSNLQMEDDLLFEEMSYLLRCLHQPCSVQRPDQAQLYLFGGAQALSRDHCYEFLVAQGRWYQLQTSMAIPSLAHEPDDESSHLQAQERTPLPMKARIEKLCLSLDAWRACTVSSALVCAIHLEMFPTRDLPQFLTEIESQHSLLADSSQRVKAVQPSASDAIKVHIKRANDDLFELILKFQICVPKELLNCLKQASMRDLTSSKFLDRLCEHQSAWPVRNSSTSSQAQPRCSRGIKNCLRQSFFPSFCPSRAVCSLPYRFQYRVRYLCPVMAYMSRHRSRSVASSPRNLFLDLERR